MYGRFTFLVFATAKSFFSAYPSLQFPTTVPNTTLIVAEKDLLITLPCDFDPSMFPFDNNICPLVLGFRHANVSIGYSDVSLVEFIKHGEMDGFKIELHPGNPSPTIRYGLEITDVRVHIHLQRQWSKYVYQYYIPCITIVIATSFSFIIPLSAIPGRVALVVTQFLTLTNIFINQMVRIFVQF